MQWALLLVKNRLAAMPLSSPAHFGDLPHIESKKIIRNDQWGFSNLIVFYDGVPSWVDERRAVDVCLP